MGYTRDAVKGVSWIGFLRFSTKAVGFLELLILARILTPTQFGAYGIALLALGLLETVTETGVNIVLLQEKEIDHYISSAWIVSIGRGLLISLILFLLTPFIASFFHSPDSRQLLFLISTVPFLRGLINPSVVKFQKYLEFNKSFIYQGTILAVDTLVSISLTYALKNPIGIVIGLIAGVLVELFLSFVIVKPRPGLDFDRSYVKLIFHRGKWVTGATIFEYLFQNLDNIAVGRFLGPAALGIYQLAYSVAVVPLLELGSVFSYVAVPILVRIKDDKTRFRNAFLKMILAVIGLAIIPTFLLIIYPKILVTLLGSQWEAVISILPILAVLGFIKAIAASSYSIFVSVNKQKYVTYSTLFNILILVLTIVPFVILMGIRGAAFSATLATSLALPILIYLVWKTLRDIDAV